MKTRIGGCMGRELNLPSLQLDRLMGFIKDGYHFLISFSI